MAIKRNVINEYYNYRDLIMIAISCGNKVKIKEILNEITIKYSIGHLDKIKLRYLKNICIELNTVFSLWATLIYYPEQKLELI